MGGLLRIVADDYGYGSRFDAGLIEAVAAGAVDAVSVMALRDGEPAVLVAAAAEHEVGLGLHLEAVAVAPFEAQLEAFRSRYEREPAHLDGHHHCHAEAGAELTAAAIGRRLGILVRAVGPRHRRLLRTHGVRTNDRLLGRLSEDEPPLPAEVEQWLTGAPLPTGLSEWMVHPGHADPATGSAYDEGRAADLALLLELGDRAAWRRRGVTRGTAG